MLNKPFILVGIGSSAGGLEALCEFFDHLSPDTTMAFVVVSHLMRNRKSVLTDILARHAPFKVSKIEKDVYLYPKHIYVIAENTMIEVKDRWIRVRKRDEEAYNNAIDIFFLSLALDFKENSVVIILSGTGDDGLRGVVEIDKARGKVLVQDPDSAEFKGMPLSIINHNHPSKVLRPAELAAQLNKMYAEQNGAVGAK